METQPRKRSWISVISLVLSLVSLTVSSGIGVVGLLWGMAIGQTQALTTSVSACREYRSEVVDLVARGFSEAQIVDVLSLEDYSEWNTFGGGTLGATGYEVRQEHCGSVNDILNVLNRESDSDL